MTCSTCGSNVPCNCLPSISPCSPTPGGGCGSNLVPTSPLPYYACGSACQESNQQRIFITQYSQALKIANSWNVPACGQTAVLSIPGLTSIVIGSYLWSEAYGYFEVTAFDPGLQQVTVVNNCNEGNAAVGTPVPACSEFINTAPPAPDVLPSTPCVEIDFTAPAIGDCMDITLSNTTGIASGSIVQIGSGFYRVDEVKPNNIITICNTGDGITPGTSVIAKDMFGNYQYCLQIISTSPCEQDTVDVGKIVVCNSSNVLTTMSSPEDGWILDGDQSSGEFENIPLGLVPFCTRLAAPLSIISGEDHYSITVDDTSGWQNGDVLHIAGYPNTSGVPTVRFTITDVTDGTHVAVTITVTPGASVTIPTDTQICRIGCCELLQNQIDAMVCDPVVYTLPIDSYVYRETVTLVGDEGNIAYFTVNPSIIAIDISSAACHATKNIVVEAHVSVASLADFDYVPADTSEESLIYHEIEAVWTVGTKPTGATAGRIIYTDSVMDTPLGGFPALSGAMWDASKLPSLADRYPMMYHQNDIVARAILPVGTNTTALALNYRCITGAPFTTFDGVYDEVSFLISGWVNIYRVSP